MNSGRDRNTKLARRKLVRTHLDRIAQRINLYLKGKNLAKIKPILSRIGRNRTLPHWFSGLEKTGTLPNLDGKTVGSVIEMLFTADVEANVLDKATQTELRINPASGVDIPDLDLGIKSPSENWCTSEPFSNAYERLLGLEFDVVALITNYQKAKESPPLKLQLIHHRYFEGHEIADKGLCGRAKKIRDHLLERLGETATQKAIRFLAYCNQSDWYCRQIIRAMDSIGKSDDLLASIDFSIKDFEVKALKLNGGLLAEYKERLQELQSEKPLDKALVNYADDWIVEHWKAAAQYPDHNDWARFQSSPLDGKLGVSFALQWRYNFGVYFKNLGDTLDVQNPLTGIDD